MILCGYDIETTGLDRHNDKMIEIGLVLYSTGMNRILQSTGFLVSPDDVSITPEITGITGVYPQAVEKFGFSSESALYELQDYANKAEAMIGHNVIGFDLPITEAAGKRLKIDIPQKLWIDTMTDIPDTKGEQLITMCAKVGFVSTGQHSAEDDAKATIEMARRHAQDPAKSWEKMVERAKSPLVLLQSHQSRNNNEDAKKFKFRWNPEYKIWWKPVKEMDTRALLAEAPFTISRLDKTYTMEMLDT